MQGRDPGPGRLPDGLHLREPIRATWQRTLFGTRRQSALIARADLTLGRRRLPTQRSIRGSRKGRLGTDHTGAEDILVAIAVLQSALAVEDVLIHLLGAEAVCGVLPLTGQC